MTNCKLQDQLSDALENLQKAAGPAGRIHVLVEVSDAEIWRQLLSHPDARLSVRRNNRPTPVVVRWVLGGDV
jgi:hypothetical protein